MINFLCAALLGVAAILSWRFARAARPYARRNLRLAALLYAGLASAGILASVSHSDTVHLTLVVGLLVSTLGPPLLAIAVIGSLSRPLFSTWAAVALTLTTMAALIAAMTGLLVLTLIPQILALCVLTLMALRAPRATALRLCLSALALSAGMLTILADTQEAGAILSLFSAAGLLGVTRALVRSDTTVQ